MKEAQQLKQATDWMDDATEEFPDEWDVQSLNEVKA